MNIIDKNKPETTQVINDYLNKHGHQFQGFFSYKKPSYNTALGQKFYWYFKNPPSNLVGVYFVVRNNPFNMIYPNEDNVYTLEELLTYKISISKAFIFWDNKDKPIIEDKIELVELNAAVEVRCFVFLENFLF